MNAEFRTVRKEFAVAVAVAVAVAREGTVAVAVAVEVEGREGVSEEKFLVKNRSIYLWNLK